jgi:hypothetical protein
MDIEIVSLDKAIEAYKHFDEGIAKKYIIDPHGFFETHAKPATQ